FRVSFGIKPLIPKVNPSPPEPTMCAERIIQASIFDIFAGHDIGRDLKAMSEWLDGHPTLVGLVADDLRTSDVGLSRSGFDKAGDGGRPEGCAMAGRAASLSPADRADHLADR